ncbi:uncharacterized protein LACBIDRAFT_306585 [Laccaria bicolor S238N-H82]|uniref:Predicted protein n=1 Tax=Laccaria bicolor (strain S238N-H82 / ATCC MYA-4686) TaxID=486041 RepID=B0DND3_LACBS|nr:uncharacterized protein LACBIDRAFT_306585 [Laccaria bicolor S238N-H82]EDR03920.1 predicted protein [Laccaria bicolor S238N-H82]|eukprot:XP_001885488.1 predicted protein [Laccaria bicolor S238N-H82]
MPSTMSDTHHGPSSPVPAATDLSFHQQEQVVQHQEHPEHHPPPTRSPAPNYFLLFTFVISVIAWVTSLTSQAIITATTPNSSTLVGVLWLAFVLQTIIILELLVTLPTHSTHLYAFQISILAAMSTVLASIGVNTNLFTPPTHKPTHQALAAGWLITAIINILWILYFTAPPSQLSGHSHSRLGTPLPMPHGTLSDPIPVTKEPSFSGFGKTGNGGTVEQQQQRLEGEDIELGQNQSRSQVDPGEEKRRSQGGWSTYTPGDRGSKAPTSGVGGRSAAGSDGGGNVSRRKSAKGEKEPTPVYRAEAMFPYTASPKDPNELSFGRGEILNIIDESGKWWEAEMDDGRKGIVPSNYLRLL